MTSTQSTSHAVPGARVFSHLVGTLRDNLVVIVPPPATPQGRESLAQQLRDSLHRDGPATAAELALRTGISPRRVSGLLANDLALGRVLSERDESTGRHSHHACLRYTLAACRGQS